VVAAYSVPAEAHIESDDVLSNTKYGKSPAVNDDELAKYTPTPYEPSKKYRVCCHGQWRILACSCGQCDIRRKIELAYSNILIGTQFFSDYQAEVRI